MSMTRRLLLEADEEGREDRMKQDHVITILQWKNLKICSVMKSKVSETNSVICALLIPFNEGRKEFCLQLGVVVMLMSLWLHFCSEV